MQITNVDVAICAIPLNRPIAIGTRKITERQYSVVQVHTDSGVSGIGLTYQTPGLIIDRIFKKIVVGKDPMEREVLWSELYGRQATPHGRWGAAVQAMGAIDTALWDIVGKTLKLPLYRLLGGKARKTPCYASAGYYEESKGPKQLAEEVAGYVDRGFRAVKMRVGGMSIRSDVERIKAVREMVGPDIDIMVDANNAYDRSNVLRAGRAFEKFDIYWFEEPLSPDDVEGSAMLAAALDTPVASGELESGNHRFRELLERKAVDIIQPDVSVCGGISEWIKIAALANAFGIPIAPHSLHDIHAHLAATFHETLFVEFFDKNSDLTKFSELYTGYSEPVNGYLKPSDRPGLGIEPNRAAIEKFKIQ